MLAPALAGHSGGPPLDDPPTRAHLVDELERELDRAGWETAHVVGNSLGGYLALQLAERGRARSVVALAPAGGWPDGDRSHDATLDYFLINYDIVLGAAARADEIVSTDAGRRRASQTSAVRYEHIPPDLLADQIRGVAKTEVKPLVELARREPYGIDPARIRCPVRIVWGTEDVILPWPQTAELYRTQLLPHADWVVLDGVGHLPQLDVPLETAELILGFTAG